MTGRRLDLCQVDVVLLSLAPPRPGDGAGPLRHYVVLERQSPRGRPLLRLLGPFPDRAVADLVRVSALAFGASRLGERPSSRPARPGAAGAVAEAP